MKRRGISPVIAVLLLIVIAVAAAVLTYVWLTGYMTSQFGAVRTSQVEERLKIEAASLDTTGSFTLYVRNIGDSDVKISTVYLLGSDGETVLEVITGTSITVNAVEGTVSDRTISSGALATVSGTFSTTITAGEVYYIKIVSNTGSEFTVRVRAG